ncbi:MAG: ornithine--oxo-acid transaminase [Planctomycetota bacterium]|nr:MAG: ornithine--oxo-acid transaminase [Planctomycetota bacterium]
MNTQDYLELEARYSAHNYAPLDVVLSRGSGAWVWDVDDNRYLDCLSAYSALNQGHQHPRIVEALIEQAQRLSLVSRAFRQDRFGPLCRKLCELSGFDKALLMNSGAEAVETAIKAARKWGYEHKGVPEGKAEIIVFGSNFHGRTTTIVGFSDDDTTHEYFGPYAPGFRLLPYGDLEEVRAAMHDGVAAILVEPIQGEAGVIVPPEDFLPGLRSLCDQWDALLICDEIQSGLGRAGALFAHQKMGVRADAVTVGKALSGGLYPVSAFLADDAVMQVFSPGTHGSTYGGNPLACAVSIAALDVLIDEGLCERSDQLGGWLLRELREQNLSKVRAVRGSGLWLGIDLEPEAGKARTYVEQLMKRGVLCKDTQGSTIRLAPPLIVLEEELRFLLEALIAVLK